jgi:polar amino acid transport system substrate-binding protein
MRAFRLPAVLAAAALCTTLSLALPAGNASAHRAGAANPLHLIHPGVLYVGSDTTYPPMESVDVKHPGQYVGADVDLAGALAKVMGLSGIRIVTTSFNSIIPALQRHNFDIIMSSMNDNPVRRKIINFVDYMSLKHSEAVLVPTSSSIKLTTYHGLCGHSVSVQSGTAELGDLQTANKSCGSNQITIKQYTADTDAFQAMHSGQSDAYTTDEPVALYYVKHFHSDVKFAGKGIGLGAFYGIGVPKSNPALRAALASALRKIEKSGEYVKILRKYGLGGTALKS